MCAYGWAMWSTFGCRSVYIDIGKAIKITESDSEVKMSEVYPAYPNNAHPPPPPPPHPIIYCSANSFNLLTSP